jgi:hypothetical protein
MPITTRTIDVFLRGVRADFALVIDQAEKQIAAYDANVYLDAGNKTGALFDEMNAVGRQRVEFTSVTGVSELLPVQELQPFPETSYVPSYITAAEPYRFARRVKVSEQAVERRDSQYQKALDEVSKLQYAYMNTKARQMFSRFNTAFATVGTTYPALFDYNDGAAMVGTHTLKTTQAPLTYSNQVTASAITTTSIENMVLVLQNQVDDIGEPMPMGGGIKYLVIPPAKVRTAKEQIDSEWIPGNANNNINVWKTVGWVMVTSPFLSASQGGSDTAWFVIDSMFSPLKDIIFKPVTSRTWYDENTKAFVYDIDFEHKVGPTDFRGIAGNLGL